MREMSGHDDEVRLTGGGRTTVHRRGDVVVRDAGPWTPTVHGLLRHLHRTGFPGSPRVVGSGWDASGRETLTYIGGGAAVPTAGDQPGGCAQNVTAAAPGRGGQRGGSQRAT